MRTWIGYAHTDRLFSYPDVGYLSVCSFPIRMCWWPWESGCLLGASARSPARPCGPAGTLHTGGAWRVARQNRVDPGAIRIGYAHVDRLLSYPDVGYLSVCSFPIRVCWWPWESGCLLGASARSPARPCGPIAMRRPRLPPEPGHGLVTAPCARRARQA